MSEERSTNAEGQSAKKFVSGQKLPDKKNQKERPKSEVQAKPVADVGLATMLVKKVDGVGNEIEGRPLKSFEKKDQAMLVQSYEKLITKVVREINNSRR